MENEEKVSEETETEIDDNLEIDESENEEKKEEIKEEKDLVQHAVEAVEHVSSQTAKELDESSEIENTKKVEAALFIAGRFLTLQELVMLTDINPLMLKEILEKLIEKYNDNSGVEIIEKGGGWKMDVRQEHVHMINKLATGNSEFTKAEQETLAVVAYKQPVKQSVIIKIRGNKAYDHVKKFIENELVVGKRVGHTKELRLSDDFYEYFHITDKKVEKISKNNEESVSDDISSEKREENSGKEEVIKEENK
ncbi:MAG: SMC-Scp complex subunit ScpB [Candidatus Nanoarchaeia archaeon]|nr:SMC-Scp complex subunit ScpB [Candidatus Nanoarchaeia archaeon]MDD5740399.1 SMC-Scp complex subunit ScpB [Candidatus Nanoarchaeia archaeon]